MIRGRTALLTAKSSRLSFLANSLRPLSSSCDESDVLASFRSIVGDENVLDGTSENTSTAGYLKGQRLGRGTAKAIALPNRVGQVPDVSFLVL